MEFITRGFKGSAVKYYPFFDNRICVTASANYGLVGNGRLYSLIFDTKDSIYDLAWSESNENQVAVACGDGSVKLFDTAIHEPFPVANYHEHGREVFAWNPNRTSSVLTLPTHSCTYSAAFSPHSPSIISSVSSDSHLRIFDLRTPSSASNHLVSLIPIHSSSPSAGSLGAIGSNRQVSPPTEALTHDWNKYREGVITTAGVDQAIRTFDLRNVGGGPVAVIRGHEYAVRKLVWSPHLSDTLLSASYDMSCRIWTDGTINATMPRQIGRMDAHTEFVHGVDWCLFGEGWCASTA
ncbi:hypothetical protein BOTNAR_0379g00100 [Botryotinia narcissicola]|uniref:Peroxin-7 n=1 Tax=Botryotinia narcissicola TaxID=278944 RepID=A0A4Z1HP18_9HELO|nr:hypothetical protein BOTNAR_0379g00100 [Botryotinia narcissicola]